MRRTSIGCSPGVNDGDIDSSREKLGTDPCPYEGGLADARRAGDEEHAALLEQPNSADQLLLATEVPLGIRQSRGRQTEVRALRARGSEHPVGHQCGVLPEDRLLELGELGARIQTELGGEQHARPAYRGKRIRLPTLAVLRRAQHHPASLAQWRLGDAGARQCGQLLHITCLQSCVQKQILHTEPQLRQTSRRDPRRPPVHELDVGLAPPQRECLRECVRGPLGFAELQLLRTPRDKSFEPLGVDVDMLRDQSVPERGRLDPVGRDEPAQPHDAAPDDMGP